MWHSRSRSRSYSPRRRGSMDAGANRVVREPPTQTSLLVRNLSRSATAEDLRYYAEKYGPLRDVYIPRDYYTKEPRGIAFVEYTNSRDAEDAKIGLDRCMIGGREIAVGYAQHGRKRPEAFSSRGGGGGGSGGYDRGGSGYDRRGMDRYRSSYGGDRDRGYDRGGYDRGGYDRGGYDRRRSRSRTRSRDRSPESDRSRSRDRGGRDRSRSRDRSVSRGRSPDDRRDVSRSPSRSRSPDRRDEHDRGRD